MDMDTYSLLFRTFFTLFHFITEIFNKIIPIRKIRVEITLSMFYHFEEYLKVNTVALF